MIDWKELFPIEGIGPLIGGALLWFGLNYLVLGPNVIGPRMAERYYLPACVAGVEQDRARMAAELRAMDERMAEALRARGEDAARAAQNQMDSVWRGLLGAYGADGEAFLQRYGDQLGGSFGGMIDQGVAAEMNNQRAAMAAERDARLGRQMEQQRYASAEAFCGCSVGVGLSDRLELALFSASLRLYKGERMAALERGETFGAQCGAPPVL